MSNPLFSIVIPTRTRAHLLRYALSSALAQQFDDYEVVVSDNESTDDTAGVVREIGDARVRYFRTGKPLAMPSSWEFALSKARGKYIIYLCDDDAAVPTLLPRVSELLADDVHAITWEMAQYHHNNWTVVESRNVLFLPENSGEVRRVDARASLTGLFDEMWPSFPVPKMLQSCVSRDLICRVQEKTKAVFIPPCPDVSFACASLAFLTEYLHIEDVLMLSGTARESNGAGQWDDKRETLTKFIDEFRAEGCDVLNDVPVDALVGINLVADSILKVKRLLSDRLSEYDLNWQRYFLHMFEGLDYFGERGVPVEHERDQLLAFFKTHSPEFQQTVQKNLDSRKTKPWRKFLRETINSNSVLSTVERKLRKSSRANRLTQIDGNRHGFSNIFECARKVPSLQKTVLFS